MLGNRDGAVVVYLPPMQTSHQCGPGVILGLGFIGFLGFSPGTPVFPPQKPTFPNSIEIHGHTLIGVSICCEFLVIVRCKLNRVFFLNYPLLLGTINVETSCE